MKVETKNKLFEAWAYCDEHDKSTEFMLQYMQDVANVSLDCVIKFLKDTTDEQRSEWYKSNNPSLVKEKFLPPDHGDVCWNEGAETFTRKEVYYLLWTQRAMISNDLKIYAGNELTENIYAVLNHPRIPKY